MESIQSATNAVCKHCSAVMGNDHKHAPAVIAEIQQWVRDSGPEWTVTRLKQLKTATIQYLATERSKQQAFRRFPTPSWCKSDRLGYPKGHLGGLITRLIDGSEREVGVLLSVLNTYTALKATQVTAKQKEKFLNAIAGPKPEGFDENGLQEAKHSFSQMNIKIDSIRDIFSKNYSEKFNFAGLNSAKPTLGPWRKTAKEWQPWVLSLIESTMVTGPWSSILEDMGVPVISGAPPTKKMGDIHVIQERGYKARVIAMPVAGVQVAFQPLHKALNHILRSLPEDCTFDQGSGVDWATNSLKQGKTLHAVDLSSATDNFPLSFQIQVLLELGYPRINEFQQVCRHSWDSDFGELSYTKGQPMGLYGSFALFALSHHILLSGIEGMLGKRDTYRILGDDVIIDDTQVANDYYEALNTMNIPVSWDKTLTSDLLTEFAGKVISPNGTIPTVKSPKNSGNLLGVDSFINYCRATRRVTHLSSVPKQYREVALALASLPTEMGGAGLNPEGLSLGDRLTKFGDAQDPSVPKFLDLGSTLLKFASGGHPWVKKVTTFINDQLMEVESEIDSSLQKICPDLINLPTSKRSLLYQVSEGNLGLPFLGTLSQTRRNPTVFDQWKGLVKDQHVVDRWHDETSVDVFLELSRLVKENLDLNLDDESIPNGKDESMSTQKFVNKRQR